MALPLSDLVLVESVGEAAPPALAAAIGMCGRVAADLGAAVTRLTYADDTPEPFLHAGKRSLRAHGPEVRSLQAGLVEPAHVLVSDVQWPAALAPRQVHVTVSMDGLDSTVAPQSEFTIEARSGLLEIVGDPARAPLRLGGHQTAYAAGLAAFTAAAAALCQPPLPEGARHARVSLLETAIWLNWKSIAVAALTGNSPKRAGAKAEWPVLPCADGYVAVVHRAQEWSRLRQIVDTPEIRAERFQSVLGRREHRAELNIILARYFGPLTRADIHALSLQHKMPFGAVWTPDELRGDPQMTIRCMFRSVSGEGGERRLPRLPVLWNEQAA